MQNIQSPKNGEILSQLAAGKKSLNEITVHLYRNNSKVVEKAQVAIYKCKKCKRLAEKKITGAERRRCNRRKKGGSCCSGNITIKEQLGEKLILAPYKGNYAAAVQSRYLRHLIKSECISKVGDFYKLNLKGVFMLLAEKNPRFRLFLETKFNEDRKTSFVLKLFTRHILEINKLVASATEGASSSLYDYWDFYDVFQKFIYFYGEEYLPKKGKSKNFPLLNQIKGNYALKKKFLRNCFLVWQGSLDFMTVQAVRSFITYNPKSYSVIFRIPTNS